MSAAAHARAAKDNGPAISCLPAHQKLMTWCGFVKASDKIPICPHNKRLQYGRFEPTI